ncbi:MAG: FecR domain-containing protein [Agriterribacter sp.]
MNHVDLTILIEKYRAGTLSEEEFSILWETLQQPENKEKWTDLAKAIWEDKANHHLADEDARHRILARLEPMMKQQVPEVITMHKRNYWWAVAASIIMLLGLGTYWYAAVYHQKQPAGSTQIAKANIVPGGNKAVLTLSNGSKLILDSAANGLLANQGNANIIKKQNGELVYDTVNKKSNETYYNTVTTPRGGQYKVTLPDGTAVWLNAESSITYPVGFDLKERKVQITGEVYFEVTKDKKRPFRVGVDDMTIEVLGTHFNVMAYKDETGKTTLLEGAIALSKQGQKTLLKPGQQAQVKESGNIAVVNNADLDEAVAWKNGQFSFTSADIGTIMRQAARWYDVKVEYKGKCAKLFSGNIPRTADLKDMLAIPEETGEVSFIIQDHTVIVIPKQ